MKTPLTAMKLILDARSSDPEIRKIEAEWLRVYLLVDRQLHMTRLPAIESDYVLELASIQRLAAEEVRELAPWCMEKNLAVSIEGTCRGRSTGAGAMVYGKKSGGQYRRNGCKGHYRPKMVPLHPSATVDECREI